MPLTIVPAGRRVRLVSVEAGQMLHGRFSAMGLVPGIEVEVIRNMPWGPFLIDVKGSRLVLGRGIVRKIMVV